MITHKFSILTAILFLLASCTRQAPPEKLLPPEPVVIKEDMVSVTKKEAPPSLARKEIKQEPEPPRSTPSWVESKGDAVYKLGKPYKVNGVWYFPAENPKYDEIGLAARYPKSFNHQRTANGEIYNEDLLTACHKTLPLPSIVQVTNLSNNKSLVLRINDRGPFVNDRLIDVSGKAADLLDFPHNESVKVRVEILSEESKKATTALQSPAPLPDNGAATAPILAIESAPNTDESFFNVSPQDQITQPIKESSDSSFDPAPTPPQNVTETQTPMAPVEMISPPGQTYYIQAGIFGNPKNASRLAQDLRSLAHVDSLPITIKGQTLTRVRVGPFQSKKEAEQILTQVKAHNLPDARITIV